MAAAADACIWASGQVATGSGGCGGLAGSPASRSVDECGRSFAVVAAARWQVRQPVRRARVSVTRYGARRVGWGGAAADDVLNAGDAWT
jgi:hypothetical protein